MLTKTMKYIAKQRQAKQKKTEGKHENQKKQPKYPKTKDLINIVSL